MKKLLLPVIALGLATSAVAQDRDTASLYNKSCMACHVSGASGAPKTGDVKAWQERLAKGMNTLVTNAKNGINAMPPKGLCMDCSDQEFEALINYMAQPKQ
jgi:cytochrome c5